MHKELELYPADGPGIWESNDAKYRKFAKDSLIELESLCEQVKQMWPFEADAPITDENTHLDVWSLCRKRDQVSDSVRLHCAMAIEGFLNLYGVVRLGEIVFNDLFERMALVPKLRTLLLVCNALHVAKNDPIIFHLNHVAQSRNSLVHPKARVLRPANSGVTEEVLAVPETAKGCVENMEAFFGFFLQAVPQAKHFLAPRDA